MARRRGRRGGRGRTERQPALTAEHRREIASERRDPTRGLYAGTLSPQDATLAQRGGHQGVAIYDEVERDPHAYAVLMKRKLALISREWTVEPASEDRRDEAAAELVRDELSRIDFDGLTQHLLDATLKGYAVVEIIWAIREGRIGVGAVKPRDQSRFRFDAEHHPRLITWENMVAGERLPARKFIVHRFGDKTGDPYGLGLGTRLFWLVFFKRQIQAQWLVHLEKFASPTAIGKYPPGMAKEEQDKLLASVTSIAQATGITVPTGTEVDFLEATRAGGDSYENALRYLDEQISECVLGETLSTNLRGGGSRAAAEVHQDIKEEVIDADADLVSATLRETLVSWLVAFNMPAANPPSVWRRQPSDEDATAKLRKANAEWLQLLDRIGYRPRHQETLDELMGIELERTPAAASGGAVGSGGAGARRPPPAFAEGDRADADLADQLGDVAGDITDGMIDRVRTLVNDASSLEELRENLLAAYGDMDVDALADVMQRAMAAAELTGMDEVEAEGAEDA